MPIKQHLYRLAAGHVVARTALAVLAVVVTALAWPRPALPFAIETTDAGSKTVVKWATSKVTYYMHPACSPDLDNKTCKDQWRAGFQGWMAVPCGGLTFQEGYHCNTALGKCLFDNVKCASDNDCPAAMNLKVIPMGYNSNGRNELVYIESGWTFGQYVLGVTSPIFYNNGAIFEADIAFNGVNYTWIANPKNIGGSYMDILSVAIHEEGHFFGVQHQLPGYYNESDPPTMAPAVDPYGKSATLNADDQLAICFLAPKGGAYSCSNDAECPYVNSQNQSTGQEYYSAKLNCINGTCGYGSGTGGTTPPAGSTDLGGTCSSDSNCKSPLFCQPFGQKAYCAQTCVPAQKNCPSGFACYAYQNKPTQGACLPGQSQPAPTKNPGDACSASSQCKSLMCVSSVCRTKCTLSNPVECNPNSEMCASVPGTGVGACVPDNKPKLLPLGSKCDAPDACQSGICLKDDIQASYGICRQPCTGKFTCPEGFACVPQSDGSQACLPGSDKLPPGSACTAPDQCASGPCVAYNGQQFCSKTCTPGDATSCPCGMGCEASTAGNLCLPGVKQGCVDLGLACANDGECVSGGLCVEAVCRAGCDVVSGDGCGPGEGCARIQAGGRQGFCTAAGKAPLSAACAGDSECASLFCDKDVSQNNEFRCLKPCDPLSPVCGPGFACNALYPAVGACFLGDPPPSPEADAGGSGPTAPGNDGAAVGGGTQPGTGATGYSSAAAAPASSCSAAPASRGLGSWAIIAFLAALAIAVRRLRLP